MKHLQITIVVDTAASWMNRHVGRLISSLRKKKHLVKFCRNRKDISRGDVAVFLSCEKIVPASTLARNEHNLVLHESNLPKGRGWSPLTWQVLGGKNKIPISLFEAAPSVDAGPIYEKKTLELEGHELLDEIRLKLADASFAMLLRFVDAYPRNRAVPQKGRASFYRRRTPEDSRLNPSKTIAQQFDLLRIVDNERYPAFFYLKGNTYIVKVYKGEKND